MKNLKIKKKQLLAFSLLTIFIFVTANSITTQARPIPFSAYGYVYDSYGSNPPIYNAKVTLIVDGNVEDIDYTDSAGYYSVRYGGLLQGPYPAVLIVEKSGYETVIEGITLSFIGFRQDFYLDSYVQVRFQGTVYDSGYYEPVYYVQGEDTYSTYADYDDVEPIYNLHLSVYDKNGIRVKDIYSDTNGWYNSGYFNIIKGSCILVAGDHSHQPYYDSESQVYTASTSQTFTTDFTLTRYLGEAWAWNQVAKEYYERTYDGWFDYQIKHQSTGSVLYDTSAGMYYSNYFITTHVACPGYDHPSWYWQYVTFYETKITIWVKNHWSGDEGFIDLSEFYYDAASWGSATSVDFDINLGVSLKGPQFGLSFGPVLGSGTSVHPNTQNSDAGNKGKLFGVFEVHWDKSKSKSLFVHWFLQSIIAQAIDQTGSHLTFEILFEHEVKGLDIWGLWSANSYYWQETLILGDDHLEPDSIAANFDPWYNLWHGTIEFS